MLGILNINGLEKKWEKRQFHLKQNEDTWPLQQLCQQNEKDDNINTRNPTEKEHHMEFCTFRGAGVCLIIFAREEDIHTHGHPETYKHTHTNRKLIKQAKIHRQRVQNRQAESWSWTVRQAAAQAGSCSGANGRGDLFPGSPSLLLFVPSSCYRPPLCPLSLIIHLPAPSVSTSLLLSPLIRTRTSLCHEPPACCRFLLHWRRLSSPNLSLQPSVSFPPLFSLSLVGICQLLLHYITVCPPPSLLLTHSSPPLTQTDRGGGGREGWVWSGDWGQTGEERDDVRQRRAGL